GGRRTDSDWLAAAAPARLVAAIHEAASACGCTVTAIVPAEAAWAATAVRLWPVLRRGRAHVLVCHGDRTDLLELADEQLTGVQRFRPGAHDAALVAEAIRESTPAPRVAA